MARGFCNFVGMLLFGALCKTTLSDQLRGFYTRWPAGMDGHALAGHGLSGGGVRPVYRAARHLDLLPPDSRRMDVQSVATKDRRQTPRGPLTWTGKRSMARRNGPQRVPLTRRGCTAPLRSGFISGSGRTAPPVAGRGRAPVHGGGFRFRQGNHGHHSCLADLCGAAVRA